MAMTEILFAGYGVWNYTNVRTDTAKGMMEDSYRQGETSITFFADNDTWGPDPKQHDRKYFFCAWRTSDGDERCGVAGEHDDTGVVVPTGNGED